MLTLNEWNQRLPKPKDIETIRRWVRNGQIWPPPKFDGYQYYVEESARKIPPPTTSHTQSLLERIKHGKESKSFQTRSPAKSVR